MVSNSVAAFAGFKPCLLLVEPRLELARTLVTRLEEWFDPARLRDDYVPSGFKGVGVRARAVPGHEFGLKLSPGDKTALIAFLKTL